MLGEPEPTITGWGILGEPLAEIGRCLYVGKHISLALLGEVSHLLIVLYDYFSKDGRVYNT